jgi:ketosteroid isomerase-like protein
MNALKSIASATLLAATISASTAVAAEDPAQTVAALDTEYQSAVERNDWKVMERILHPDFTLVLGNGTVYNREDLVESARDAQAIYEKQVEMPGTQTVRLFGRDTAVVTALLWLKGKRKADGSQFEYKLWFSDTYVRTADGWRYAFGQASLKLPD